MYRSVFDKQVLNQRVSNSIYCLLSQSVVCPRIVLKWRHAPPVMSSKQYWSYVKYARCSLLSAVNTSKGVEKTCYYVLKLHKIITVKALKFILPSFTHRHSTPNLYDGLYLWKTEDILKYERLWLSVCRRQTLRISSEQRKKLIQVWTTRVNEDRTIMIGWTMGL